MSAGMLNGGARRMHFRPTPNTTLDPRTTYLQRFGKAGRRTGEQMTMDSSVARARRHSRHSKSRRDKTDSEASSVGVVGTQAPNLVAPPQREPRSHHGADIAPVSLSSPVSSLARPSVSTVVCARRFFPRSIQSSCSAADNFAFVDAVAARARCRRPRSSCRCV